MTSILTQDANNSISEDTMDCIHSWLCSVPQSTQQLLEDDRDYAIEESYDFEGNPSDVADYIQASVAETNKAFYRDTVIDDVELDYGDDTIYIAGDAGDVGVSVQITLQQLMQLAVDAGLHKTIIYDDCE